MARPEDSPPRFHGEVRREPKRLSLSSFAVRRNKFGGKGDRVPPLARPTLREAVQGATHRPFGSSNGRHRRYGAGAAVFVCFADSLGSHVIGGT
jgi:hypothetical protein